MQKEFDRFKEWLRANYKEGLDDLNPPASNEEIKELSDTLGLVLPNDLICLLKIHNGQKGEAAWLFDSQEFLSTHGIIDAWNNWNRFSQTNTFPQKPAISDEGIKDVLWNKKWIPFSSNGSGDHYCIDLDPTSSGISAQIITLWHDYEERELVSLSLKDWFNDYLEQLFSGDFFYSKEYNSIVNKNEI
ncbi:MAG: molybdenum cofactor biosynthesis protein MoeA [Arcobacter sp.]|nr:MAG: molybdenum cofactor biosynthesis protein MoeA [Arcobacter sp.]